MNALIWLQCKAIDTPVHSFGCIAWQPASSPFAVQTQLLPMSLWWQKRFQMFRTWMWTEQWTTIIISFVSELRTLCTSEYINTLELLNVNARAVHLPFGEQHNESQKLQRLSRTYDVCRSRVRFFLLSNISFYEILLIFSFHLTLIGANEWKIPFEVERKKNWGEQKSSRSIYSRHPAAQQRRCGAVLRLKVN